ncbi:MAG: c-type cytochrome [Cellvibrio sp.]
MSIIIAIHRVALGLAIFSLAACGGGPSFDGGSSKYSAQSSVATFSSAASGSIDVARGKSLYEASCSGCHGTQGDGGVAVDPTKELYRYSLSDQQQALEDYISDWMPSPGAKLCTDECARNIAAYIRSWNGQVSSSASTSEQQASEPIISSSVDSSSVSSMQASSVATSIDPSSSSYDSNSSESSLPLIGDVEAGATIYQARCGNCHGADGNGRIPIDPTRETFKHSQSEIEQTLIDYTAERMPPRGDKCSGQCAVDVSAFIRSWIVSEPQSVMASMEARHSLFKLGTLNPIYPPVPEFESSNIGYRLITREELVNQLILLTQMRYEFIESTVNDSLNLTSYLSLKEQTFFKPELSATTLYQSIVQRLVRNWVDERFNREFICISSNRLELCEQELIDIFAPKVLGRSLKDYEKSIYTSIYLESSDAGDVEAGIKAVIEALLFSPDFLYRKITKKN